MGIRGSPLEAEEENNTTEGEEGECQAANEKFNDRGGPKKLRLNGISGINRTPLI